MSDATVERLDQLLALAVELAVSAGDVAAAARRGEAVLSDTKSTTTDLVTAHDRAAEMAIVTGLTAARPDDAIIGEEGTNRAGTSGVSWFIDPIDGTTNFVYGLPQWATSVAAGDAAGTLVGVVYLPSTGELFAAARGRGATLDGSPISCRAISGVGLALVATGFEYAADRRRAQAKTLVGVIGAVRDIRRMGAASVDLCYVAAGRLDAYYEEHLNLWDVAAGELIAREAGCRTGDYAGGPVVPTEVLAASPGIFDDLSTLLTA